MVWLMFTNVEWNKRSKTSTQSKESYFNKVNVQTIFNPYRYIVDAVTSSGILKAKQKLGVTFNFDKQDIIDLTKISKMTMRRASEANSEK